jgi:hypothetical protein
MDNMERVPYLASCYRNPKTNDYGSTEFVLKANP